MTDLLVLLGEKKKNFRCVFYYEPAPKNHTVVVDDSSFSVVKRVHI